MTLSHFDPTTVDHLKHALLKGFELPYQDLYLDIQVTDESVQIRADAQMHEIPTALDWVRAWHELATSTPRPVGTADTPAGETPWHFSAGQAAQVAGAFEALELAAVEASDAMGSQLTTRLTGKNPEVSFRIARDNLQRVKAEAELLLEIIDLSEAKHATDGSPDGGQPPASGAAIAYTPGAGQSAPADRAGDRHQSGDPRPAAAGGIAPDAGIAHPTQTPEAN